jgi:hypothetical protein
MGPSLVSQRDSRLSESLSLIKRHMLKQRLEPDS